MPGRQYFISTPSLIDICLSLLHLTTRRFRFTISPAISKADIRNWTTGPPWSHSGATDMGSLGRHGVGREPWIWAHWAIMDGNPHPLDHDLESGKPESTLHPFSPFFSLQKSWYTQQRPWIDSISAGKPCLPRYPSSTSSRALLHGLKHRSKYNLLETLQAVVLLLWI